MNRPIFQCLVFTVVVLCVATSVEAQSTEFTYQGRLLSGEMPANGSHDFEFTLWDDEFGGNQIGSVVTLTEVNVNNGVFSVRINFGDQFPGANRFLEIKVKQSGGATLTTLTPRQAISSSPYAIKSINAQNAANADIAQDASRLGGIAPGQYVITTDTRLSDARNPLPNSASYIQNTTILQPLSNFNISGNGIIRGTLAVVGGISGNGSSLTNLNAANITSGTIDNTRLSIVPVSKGGTGLAAPGAFGNLLRSNGSIWVTSSLNALDIPPGSTSYIQNTTAQQATSNFNISGNGTAAGTLAGNIINAATQFNIGGDRVMTGTGGNLFVGNQATGLGGVANATALGFRALVQQSNSLVLGSINGINGATADTNVGIGTATPLQRLHIGANGSSFLVGHGGCPSGSVAVGFGANLTNCNNYSLLGNGTDTFINRPTGGIIALRRNNVNQMTLTDTAVNITGDLNASSLAVNGQVTVANLDGAGGDHICRNSVNKLAFCSSSIRYKNNVTPFDSGLSLIQRLRPVSFNWKANGTLDFGLVAEEVAETEPLLVTRNAKGEIEGVKYDRVGVVLVNAVQEQQMRIDAQQKQIDEQTKTINRQQSELEALRTFVCSQNPTAEFCRLKY